MKIITNFIAFNYYSDSGEVISEFSKEKSKKILKTILEEAPFLLFTIPYIGNLGSVQNELNKNFKDYYSEKLIEDLFTKTNSSKIMESDLSLSYENKNDGYWQSENADKFLHTLIEHLTVEKNVPVLYRLDFILKEQKMNDERPYDKKIDYFSTQLSQFACNPEYEKNIEKALLFIKLMDSTNLVEKKHKNKNKI